MRSVDLGIFAVLVVLVLVELVGVVGRVADDDTDLLAVLPLDARDVLLAHAAEQIADMLALLRLQAAMLSSVSTKHRFGNSSYSPVIAA